MKPKIGIIMRPLISEEENNMHGVYNEIADAIEKSGGIPIGILPLQSDWEEIINKCDGLIFQGGDEEKLYEKIYMKYAYYNDIPTLGICLGMQIMGTIFDGILMDIKEHKKKGISYVHEVIISKNSKLYDLLKTEKIMVNSRHKSSLINTHLDIVAKSSDGIIEAIEDKKKKFFLGVQWHPESMYEYDKLQRKLFNLFIDVCRK